MGSPKTLLRSMRIRKFWIYGCMFILYACDWSPPTAQQPNRSPYYDKIRQWQEQIRKEGWSAATVDDIINETRRLTKYETEFEDNWLTPAAFIRAGFQGDCEDIAIFMMGTLKRVGYPHKVRILVIRDILYDHAQLKVQLPDGKWKWYESTRKRSYTQRPKKWQPIVEFDEHTIIYHDKGTGQALSSLP